MTQNTFPVLSPSDIVLEVSNWGLMYCADQIERCETEVIHKLFLLLTSLALGRSEPLEVPQCEDSTSAVPMFLHRLMSKLARVGVVPELRVLFKPSSDVAQVFDVVSGYINFIKYRVAVVNPAVSKAKEHIEQLKQIDGAALSEQKQAKGQVDKLKAEWERQRPILEAREKATDQLLLSESEICEKLKKLEIQENQILNESEILAKKLKDLENEIASEKQFKQDIAHTEEISKKISSLDDKRLKTQNECESINQEITKITDNEKALSATSAALDEYLSRQEQILVLRVKISKTLTAAKELRAKKTQIKNESLSLTRQIDKTDLEISSSSAELQKVAGAKLLLQEKLKKLQARLLILSQSASSAETLLSEAKTKGAVEIECAKENGEKTHANIINFQTDFEKEKNWQNQQIAAAKHKIDTIVKNAKQAVVSARPPSPKRKRI